MRYLLEKTANFNDIERVILSREELGIDATIEKKCGKPGQGITIEQFQEIIGGLSKNAELTDLDSTVDNDVRAKRCILYALATTVLQLKKTFTHDILTYVVQVINGQDLEQFNLTTTSSIIELFRPVAEPQEGALTVPPVTEKQLNTLCAFSERILYSGISLYIYLLTRNLTPIATGSFVTFLEAVGCDLKFLGDFKAINQENRTLINQIFVIEKFFHKRNNKKGKGTTDMLETCLLFVSLRDNLKDLKFRIKDIFGGEFNPSLKKTYSETRYISRIWKSIGVALQQLSLTLMNLLSLYLSRLYDLCSTYYGEERANEINSRILKSICVDVTISLGSSYNKRLFDAVQLTISFLRAIEAELGISNAIISDRLFKDANDPKRKKKKKAGFKLGEGSLHLLENVFFQQSYEELVKPEDEAEIQEDQAPTKEFEVVPATLDWGNLQIQGELKTIFNSIVVTTRRPKVPKGVRDSTPIQMCIKNVAFDAVKSVFRKHGAVEIDTPIFELKETLLGKYGEEGGKLIYDLKDQGGELLSLRYDLTVPFSRFCATNNIEKIKRFHIGKVYRRDQPNMNRGRFREFYQCDIDIAGRSGKMIADAEILSIIKDIMDRLGIKFEIKLCHRRLLEAVIEEAGCRIERFKTICSSIDKLDKEPWEAVADELINMKGIAPEAVAKIEPIVQNRGTILELIAELEEKKTFGENQKAKEVFDDLKILADYVKQLGVYDNITLDLSLARGLDYYTGIIFEIVTPGYNIGSLGGGGRYDNLIGMFSGKNKDIPSVGFSFGIERLFVVLEDMHKNAGWIRGPQTLALVTSVGKGLAKERFKLVSELWSAGISSEVLYAENPKPDKALSHATDLGNKVPFILWIGETEIAEGYVTLKCVYKKQQVRIERAELVERMRENIEQYNKDLEAGEVDFGSAKGGKGKKKA